MTDEPGVKESIAPEAPPPPSREDRANALVADLKHAMKHNAPVSIAMLKELQDLLGVEDAPVVEAAAAD